MKYYINSLSLGVREIYERGLNPQDCEIAVLGTRIQDLKSLTRAMGSYSQYYWQKDPDKMREIAFKIWTYARVIQPRLDNMDWMCMGGHVFENLEDMAVNPDNKKVMDFYHLL